MIDDRYWAAAQVGGKRAVLFPSGEHLFPAAARILFMPVAGDAVQLELLINEPRFGTPGRRAVCERIGTCRGSVRYGKELPHGRIEVEPGTQLFGEP